LIGHMPSFSLTDALECVKHSQQFSPVKQIHVIHLQKLIQTEHGELNFNQS